MKSKILSTILWVLGLIFILRGVTLIGDSFFGSLLMVVGGVAVLPPFHKKIREIAGFPIHGGWFAAFAILILSLSGNTLKHAEEAALANGTASPELVKQDAERKQRAAAELKLQQERDAKRAEKEAQEIYEREQHDKEISMQIDAKRALISVLKDPDSATIRNQNGFCGEVNSKNSFGGYTGFRRFIASSAIVAIEGENMDSSEFQKVWDQICK
ncbi:hypothetical protein M5F00_09260 [Acinetobacter sp. ANC 4945]|uniref:hypothetical protein n=1 Tax=Acinetobacter amyesii TaxID=2942470 RepID=UPI001D170A81|nr:hypothetical protein [Acinetobacter amyesii]MCL6248049.1 hypothetical protein [Acinetobacter amyesii]